MSTAVSTRFTLNDLRQARAQGRKVPMLTCYDYSTARLMSEAGLPTILVGDSAANVILGHDSTVKGDLAFQIQITAAVRRGAPNALLVGDLPFGSYQASDAQGVRNAVRMLKLTGCDCIKLEVAAGHASLISRLADAGIAVMAHLGLRPQAVGLLGGYRVQGRTAESARQVVQLAQAMTDAGAVSLLLEAVPPEVGEAVVKAVDVPVIGCGAGPACHGFVFVTHDAIGLSPTRPKFAPQLGDVATPLKAAFSRYVKEVTSGQYPAAEHNYEMPAEEKSKFLSK